MSGTKRIQTADGSHSLWISGLDETYHSRHGAIQESRHVFIDQGLREVARNLKEVTILEVGFGTGLNALLALHFAREEGTVVHYTSIEKYPLQKADWNSLNFGEMLDDQEGFSAIHESNWEEEIKIDPRFYLQKNCADIDAVQLGVQYDLIFYDAFGPRVQPNMWTVRKLECAVRHLRHNGVFVTYCAQGQFRRNLAALGMTWESLPGPPGKREMTRAIKS